MNLLLALLVQAHPGSDQIQLLPEFEVRGSEHAELTTVVGVTIDNSGLLHVLDAAEALILTFAGDGRLLRRIGGRGSGPGELMRPSQVGMVGDTMWVADKQLRRFTLLTSQGAAVRTVSDPAESPGDVALMAGSRIVSYEVFRSDPSTHSQPAVISVYAEGTAKEIARFPEKRRAVTVDFGNARMYTPEPFVDFELWSVEPGGRSFIVLTQGAIHEGKGRLLLEEYGSDGRRRRSLELDLEARRFHVSALRAWTQDWREFPNFGRVPATENEKLIQALESSVHRPQYFPLASYAKAGGDGLVAVRRENIQGDGISWSLVSMDDGYLGDLLPGRYGYVAWLDSTRLVVVDRDADWLPVVTVYRLRVMR